MKPSITIACALGVLLALGACAAGSAESHHAATSGLLGQFLLGLWHGIIAPLTLIVEIVNKLAPKLLPWTAHIYEAQGTGVVYDVGFYLGLVGSPLIAWSRRPRRQ
ncbi:MAG: hypothetical protein ACHP84_04985 [Caulobacterales bacterium]